jgi:TRAP-type C4-dicarboxylate transport system substrate-binding protein
MRKILSVLCGLLLIISTAKAETWDMATPYPDFEFLTRNIRQFAQDVANLSGQKLEIKVHSGQSLIRHPEIKNAVRSRQIPIGEFLLARLANENPVYELDAIPFLAASYPEALALWQAQRPFVTKHLADQGLRVLFSVPWPPQGLYAKREITDVKQLQGLRFRTYNVVTEQMAKLLGMVPTQTEATEMATAFITGRIDAMMTSPMGGAGNKAWDWSTHFYNVQAWLPKNIVVVNERIFQRLDKDTQKVVLDAAAKAEKRGWEMSEIDTKEGVDLLVKNGMKGITPSPELIKELKKTGEALTAEWLKTASPESKAVVENYVKRINAK